MEASTQVPPLETTVREKGVDAQSTIQQWDPGPDLELLSLPQRRKLIREYAWKHHRGHIAITIVAVLLLCLGAYAWNDLHPPIQSQNSNTASSTSPTNWADWLIRIQAFLGLPTLFVAIFVWYGNIQKDWENDLPNRMSVFFLHNGLPAIICRYVWLAGEDDLRAWGQQVAAQAVGEPRLSFYPNVSAQIPKLAIWIDGNICKHYTVCFELMDMDQEKKQNLFLKKYSGKCCYQNMAIGSNIVSPVPLADLQRRVSASVFPFDWPENKAINSVPR